MKSTLRKTIIFLLFLSSACSLLPVESLKEEEIIEDATEAPTPTLPVPTATVELFFSETPPTSSGDTLDFIDGMEVVFIPAGDFIMGCEGIYCTVDVWPGPYPDNMVQIVHLDDYWFDMHQVTIGQYNQCVGAGTCEPYKQNNIPPQGVEYFTEPQYSNYPVINVSWFMARDYCGWAGRRLPTEAEWEKAARGMDGRKYPWGDDLYTEDKGNMCDIDCPRGPKGDVSNPNFDDGYQGPAPIGSYPEGVSPYGVLDMAGNVWEWTSTAAEPYPYDAKDGRESQYDIEYNAKWPERILRGGTWNGGYAYLRSSFRYRIVGIYANMGIGFRCAYSEQAN